MDRACPGGGNVWNVGLKGFPFHMQSVLPVRSSSQQNAGATGTIPVVTELPNATWASPVEMVDRTQRKKSIWDIEEIWRENLRQVAGMAKKAVSAIIRE